MKAKPVIMLFILAIAGYLGFLLYRQLNLLKKTCIKIVGCNLNGLLTKSASLNIVLSITNNSDIDLQAQNGKFQFLLNNIPVAKVNIPITKTLNAHQSIQLPLTAYFNPSTVIKQGIQSLLSDPNNIIIGINGKVSVISSGIAFNNIKISEKFMLSDLLKPSSNQNNC